MSEFEKWNNQQTFSYDPMYGSRIDFKMFVEKKSKDTWIAALNYALSIGIKLQEYVEKEIEELESGK